ncbi:MAG TPA: hypothetical protein VGJ29_08345 [Vicinamibacterales bacterium]
MSNINGEGTARDNNGYISRVAPDGRVLTARFIEGGHNAVTLNAPKGLATRRRAVGQRDGVRITRFT